MYYLARLSRIKLNRFPSNLSHWLLYSSALDVSQDTYDGPGRENRSKRRMCEKAGEGLSMTLDRPSKTSGSNSTRRPPDDPTATTSGIGSNKLSSYPPVLGYLATLTRSKASKQLRHQRDVAAAIINNNDSTAEGQQHQLNDRSAVRRLSGLFTKNSSATGQREPTTMTATKIKNKLSAAPGILKTALFRSRSKDSFLDPWFHENHSSTTDPTPWQHKSSVPCYVGWRPPMPLPKDCPATDQPSIQSLRSANNIRSGRVTRTESRRSNLGWRKYVSESDLLDPSESGYMAIDRAPIYPSWPPTLALLTPVLGRLEGQDSTSYSQTVDDTDHHSSQTLPRKFQSDWFHSSSPSLRVQFNLEHDHTIESFKTTTSTARQVCKAELQEYSLRLKKRLQSTQNDSHQLTDRSGDGQRCGPWYDLWAPDPSVRLCEIAQL